MNVGHTLAPTPFNPSGLWPTSEAPREPGKPYGGPCPLLSGLGGVFGGCVVDTDQTRAFTYDQIGFWRKSWIAEAKLASRPGGPVNWLAGAQYTRFKASQGGTVSTNQIDAIATFGGPPGAPPQYASYDLLAARGTDESYAAFGEIRWQPTDRLKLTLGLRYSDGTSKGDLAVSQLLATQFLPPPSPGQSPRWVRNTLASWFFPSGPSSAALALTDHYGVTDQARSATNFESLVNVLQAVPPIPPLGEARAIFGAQKQPSVANWSGRAGVDWLVAPEVMLFAFYSRGHSPGGLKVNSTFENRQVLKEEVVNAFEIGLKSRQWDGSLMFNASAFYNILKDQHVTARSIGSPFEFENLDADSWGVEVESQWRPTNNLALDLSYGWLKTRIKDAEILDIIDLTQGDPSLVLLRQPFGLSYVAPRAEVLPLVPLATAIGFGGAAGADVAPAAIYP